jgi:hypothetical protein
MSIKDNLDEAQKKVKELQDQLRDITLEPSAIIDISNLTKANNAINTLTKAVTAAKKEASDLEKGFKGVFDNVTEIVKELQNGNNAASLSTKSFKSIQDITQKLKYDQQDISKLNIDQLKSLQKKLATNQQEIRDQAKLIEKKYEENGLDATRLSLGANGKELSKTQLKNKASSLGLSVQELKNEQAIAIAAKENFKIFEDTNDLLDKRIQKEKEINRTMGLTKVALEGLGKIPIVGPLLDVNKALDAAREKAEDNKGALASMSAAMGSMGKSLFSSLGDPLVVIGLLIKGFKMFLDIGFAADKQITDLSKSMAVSHEEAAATRDRMIEIQNSGKDIFMTTKNQVEAQMELASAMGATRGFTEQQIADQVLLTKKMGLTAEEAGGIQMLAASNGMTAKNVTNSIIKQTSALAKQTGIQLDNKQIVQEVAKVSGQLRLQYANNPKLIAKAVVETKKLGINMEIAANAAKGLLQFEDSIENELSAELLTGKALNLERARGLALNGDSVGAAKEMLAQVGSAADFQNMNVIQQEAIAKAVGMSTDDLANSLVTQENLKKLGDETRNQIEEKIKAAKALGTVEGDNQARQLEASIGSEEQAQKALEAVDAQQTFNQSIEKLKSMFTSIVEGPAGDFAKFLSENVAAATTMLGLFIAIKGVLLASSVITAASIILSKRKEKIESDTAKKEIVGSSFKMASGLGILGIAIVAGLIGAGIAYLAMNKGGEVPGTNTTTDSIPAMLTSGEYVIPNSNGKTGTEKYNEMISSKPPAMFNEGGKVSINPNKGNLTPSVPSDNKGNNQDLTSLIPAINGLQNNIKSLIQIHVDFLKELKLILTPTIKIPTKETPIKNEISSLVKNPSNEIIPTKETSLKKEITPSDLLNILTPFSSMLKVGSLLLSKSIETKNNSIKPIENNSIESKQTNIDQNVVKPIEDNTTASKQNNIDQNVNKSTTFSLFNFQNDSPKNDTGVIQAINGLRSDLKALASRPIHTSVQLNGKELATMQGKYPNEAGDANGQVAYQMS